MEKRDKRLPNIVINHRNSRPRRKRKSVRGKVRKEKRKEGEGEGKRIWTTVCTLLATHESRLYGFQASTISIGQWVSLSIEGPLLFSYLNYRELVFYPLFLSQFMSFPKAYFCKGYRVQARVVKSSKFLDFFGRVSENTG